MIYQGLLETGTTPDRINEKDGKMVLEPRGRESLQRAKKAIHDGTNPGPLRRPMTSYHRD